MIHLWNSGMERSDTERLLFINLRKLAKLQKIALQDRLWQGNCLDFSISSDQAKLVVCFDDWGPVCR
jgi:hypothetical protein